MKHKVEVAFIGVIPCSYFVIDVPVDFAKFFRTAFFRSDSSQIFFKIVVLKNSNFVLESLFNKVAGPLA